MLVAPGLDSALSLCCQARNESAIFKIRKIQDLLSSFLSGTVMISSVCLTKLSNVFQYVGGTESQARIQPVMLRGGGRFP